MATARIRPAIAAVLTCAALVQLTASAEAQNLIKRPGAHIRYQLELEPHLAFVDPGSDSLGIGPGVRASFQVADRALIRSLNNSLAIGIGAELAFASAEVCHRHDGDDHCHSDGEPRALVPVVAQWNFWFTRNWSTFVEPGVALRLSDHGLGFEPIILSVGGRYLFEGNLAFNLRVGWPAVTAGVSIFL